MRQHWKVVGVAGATCAGKSTLVRHLMAQRPNSKVLHHDDFFFPVEDPRHTMCTLSPEISHINFEILSSLDNDRYLEAISSVLNESSPDAKPNFLFLDGFLLFNEPRIVELCDVKIFLDLSRETCWERRKDRVYNPPDPPGYFDQIVWPGFVAHSADVRAQKDMFVLDGSLPVEELLHSAEKYLVDLEKGENGL